MIRYVLLGILVTSIAAAMFYKTLEYPPTGEFGGVSLRIEQAVTDKERERGLAGREEISPDFGMLFMFPSDDYYGIWMKEMKVPIDIFWLDSERRVVSMALDVATSTYPNVFYPSHPSRYVLETAAGFGRRHGVATGTRLHLKK